MNPAKLQSKLDKIEAKILRLEYEKEEMEGLLLQYQSRMVNRRMLSIRLSGFNRASKYGICDILLPSPILPAMKAAKVLRPPTAPFQRIAQKAFDSIGRKVETP